MKEPLKVHCSSLSAITTEPRLKADKEAGNLSETAKKEVRKMWIADNFDKHKEYFSKYTDKGNECEQRGITMLSRHLDLLLLKNDQYFYSDYLIGTPDIVEDDFIADIKCPYDLENYMTADPMDYEDQMQGYLHITGKKLAILAYCLVDAPEWLIAKEIKSLCYRSSPDMEQEITEAVRKNMTFDNVPEQVKVKCFEFVYDPAKIEAYNKKVIKCREYYDTLNLVSSSVDYLNHYLSIKGK